jgi:glucosamine kinase
MTRVGRAGGFELRIVVELTLMAIFLGIDGGGTQTSCLIGDETSVLGSGTGGASNVVRVGEVAARRALIDAIRQACEAARISPAQVTRTCVGIAGAARPVVADVVRRIVTELVSGNVEIVGDMVIALHSAFGWGPGIVVIAGTGSVAYGRGLDGNTTRAGGWGFAISDEGSGHWIGRAAVTIGLRAAEENRASESSLLAEIMKFWNVGNVDALVVAANASPAPDFAALFPTVLAAANSGDGSAAEVLKRAGHELAALAKIVVGRLFSDAKEAAVAMVGGVFRNSALVREAFWNELRHECTQVEVDEKMAEPVRGAFDLARKGTVLRAL